MMTISGLSLLDASIGRPWRSRPPYAIAFATCIVRLPKRYWSRSTTQPSDNIASDALVIPSSAKGLEVSHGVISRDNFRASVREIGQFCSKSPTSVQPTSALVIAA